MRIACPKCEYEPRRDDRWQCTCGMCWNTFETQGRCPGCGKVWHRTCCPRCFRWSPHHDWYQDLPPVDALLHRADEPAASRTG
ncbi:MAG: hypothetical protein KatS3mg043_0842 [Rhodothermaceae bacterium]|nr:MAG: hypothetical protein KatS3mg043_0842 [Rhodothermaceae bacterium]